MLVAFCVPTLVKPYQCTLDSIERSLHLLGSHGYDTVMVSEVGNPYISNARATMLRKALDAKADIIVFLDHDLSWRPEDMLKLVETEGDYVAGTYRFKKPDIEYMGQLIPGEDGRPIVRESDGALLAACVPAGFLKITRRMVNKFAEDYPELLYGERCNPHIDLFNHGAMNFVWYGEDYALSKRWLDMGEKIWLIPDIELHHHTPDNTFEGNFHEFLLRQPGGSDHGN